ncbi:MAG: hypothetical protein KAJ62_06110 [Desulfobacteraceae bacterium]|nr:hypothetical protein [Desulfobacteraceae bacterium]
MTKFEQGLFDTDPFDLRGKQSVRATFKLSKKAIDSLGLVAVHMGIKQKSLFDHIIEDASTLKELARQIQIQKFKKKTRVQKTYVLSRKTIEILETISDTYDLPRDALVEYSIMQLESVIIAEKENHKKRKALFNEVADHFEQGRRLFSKSLELLGENDPFCKKLEKGLLAYNKEKNNIESFLKKSKPLEDF